ncbi:hypothetical protein BTM25_20720 [Actinomadura rubteroloni]|uniref:Uncharacterized protein n=1 Tax=Actinomadura rubteroloni TaxID=1926885 RepID=A0A2P4URI2_9ACTN|nr:hypothetical protein [Actinomadura rubteroloni]POM27655.1 hypothetical protein BTM25_20720 [Actinomadura rubteroloni]
MGHADQLSFDAPDDDAPLEKPTDRREVEMQMLITVKAAPNPSETYGETVCVAGIRIDCRPTAWIRLYPINFRQLESEHTFKKYDIVWLKVRPTTTDPRAESYRPIIHTVRTEAHLDGWKKRRPFVVDHVQRSMCEVLNAVRDRPPARSLAAVRPRTVKDLKIEPHPGWTTAEQAKIDRYMQQEDLFDSAPRTALEAPRFKGWYRYLCESARCKGHEQGIYDWEWVALQRNLRDRTDADIRTELRRKFFDQMCGPGRDTVFYVGNQAKHQHGFMVLGCFYPKV